MDPETCLLEACDALGDGRDYDAADRLHDYDEWRRGGGFEPLGVLDPAVSPYGMDGDTLADLIRRKLEEQTC